MYSKTTPDQAGQLDSLGRYRIHGELGRGSMGVVYRAQDPVLDRPVALKTLLLPESFSELQRRTFLERFFLEAKIAAKLIHPHIVVTYDADTDEKTGVPFIAMELVEGESLSQRLAKRGRLDWEGALDVVIPLARGLDYAHAEGIVHRDIKPANVLLTRREVPKIADFGIAKLQTAELTQTGMIVGTPYFMSPEQLRGEKLDGRSDLFSLAALLYNLLTGRPPFGGAELASIASQVLYKDPVPPCELFPGIPPGLDGVLAVALMKSADDRHASAGELADELVLVRQGEAPRRAPPLGLRTQAQKPESFGSSSAPPAAPAETPGASAKIERLGRVPRLRAWVLGRLRMIAALTALVGLGAGLYFREEIVQQKLFLEAKRAAAKGELPQSEAKLEELVQRDPSFTGAVELLRQVSRELLKPRLPLEFSARHNHRLGSCTGRLTLHDWGMEFSSGKHGLWQWHSDRVFGLERRSEWGIGFATNEPEMLGLLTTKNYNFSLLSAALAEEDWRRYRRLFP
jgi:hypothetical protein